METRISVDSSTAILKVEGAITFENYGAWRKIAEEVLDIEAPLHIVDLAGLSSIDSAGLGMMLSMKKWADERKRKVELRYDPETTVGKMLKLAKFETVMEGVGGT